MRKLASAVLFDLNGVGEDYFSYMRDFDRIRVSVLERGCASFGISYCEQKLAPLVSAYLAIGGGTPFHHHPSFWQHLFESIVGRGLSYLEIRKLYGFYLDSYQATIGAYPDFLEVIAQARARMLKIGIVANGNTERVYRFLDKFSIRDLFATIVTSGGGPFAKPNVEIFDLALLNLGNLSPLTTVFVGDRLENDVTGANKAGMWSVRLLRADAEGVGPKGSKEEPDFSITNLSELFSLPLFGMNNSVSAAVIPCGGRGSRMGSLTDLSQKCMLPFNGKPILASVVRELVTIGISDIHFLLGYRAEDVVRYFEREARDFKAHFHYVNSASTGDALMQCMNELPDAFLYSHGNILFDRSLVCSFLKAYYKRQSASTFVVTKQPIAKTHPIFIINQGGFCDYPIDVIRDQASRKEHVLEKAYYSVGLAIVLKEDLLAGCMDRGVTTEQLLKGVLNRTRVYEYDGEWLHVESASDLNYGMSRPMREPLEQLVSD